MHRAVGGLLAAQPPHQLHVPRPRRRRRRKVRRLAEDAALFLQLVEGLLRGAARWSPAAAATATNEAVINLLSNLVVN